MQYLKQGLTAFNILSFGGLAAGLLYWNLSLARQQKNWEDSGASRVGQVVYAERDIKAGSVIGSEDILELPLAESKLRSLSGCILCKDFALGRKVKFDIAGDEILDFHSLEVRDGEAEQNLRLKEHLLKASEPFCAHRNGSLMDLDVSKVFKAKHDLPEGTVITAESVMEVHDSDEPSSNDSAHASWQILGRHAKYGIAEGMTISKSDSLNSGEMEVQALAAARDMDAGAKISDDSICRIKIPAASLPRTAICEPSLLSDCRTNQRISKGALLRAVQFDLVPAKRR